MNIINVWKNSEKIRRKGWPNLWYIYVNNCDEIIHVDNNEVWKYYSLTYDDLKADDWEQYIDFNINSN